MQKFNYDTDITVGYYDEIYKRNQGIQSAWHHHKFEFVSKLLGDSKCHLDVGCGPGTFIGNYMSGDSVGVDLSEQQIAYAKKAYTRNTFIASAGNLPFEDNFFESISIIEVIEHLEIHDIKALLSECRRVLKPEGRIVVTTPNYKSLWPLLEFVVNKYSPLSYVDQHITKFNSKRLFELFERSNYKNVKISSFIFTSPFLAFLSWPLASLCFKLESRYSLGFLGFLLSAKAQK